MLNMRMRCARLYAKLIYSCRFTDNVLRDPYMLSILTFTEKQLRIRQKNNQSCIILFELFMPFVAYLTDNELSPDNHNP